MVAARVARPNVNGELLRLNRAWGECLRRSLFVSAGALCLAAACPVAAQQNLPAPTGTPLTIDFSSDPVLALRRQTSPVAQFQTEIGRAVARNPSGSEAVANLDEARAGLEEAREQRLPSADISLSTYRILSREFSNDPNNIIESSRAPYRTDALATLSQNLFDFGAGEDRIRAAGARIRAARAGLEATADQVAMTAIAAWYDVLGYRALVGLTQGFVVNLGDLRESVQLRIRGGVSAEADIALADVFIARSEARLAQFRRQLAVAEARYIAVTGEAPPRDLARGPVPRITLASRDAAAIASGGAPAVRSAEAEAEASRQLANAARADRLPTLTGQIDAGRYGVFETDNDYDIRARATIRYRLFGGQDARGEQASARARAAGARADRIREDAERDAAIAWTDVRALEQQLDALESAYIAGRRARDAITERFRASRGDLFDVAAAEESYFQSATAYIQGLTELDATRYILLSRTGQLLDRLNISADGLGGSLER